jgi:RNA polymerase sigma-70 factor (ECF subfamily)
MLRDKLLIHKFNRGSKEAFRCIYETYKDQLLALAIALLKDQNAAEDVLHDVFVSFAQSAGTFRLTGSLKSYLSTCIANKARDRNRTKASRNVTLDSIPDTHYNVSTPETQTIQSDETKRLHNALAELPYDQREAIVLHLHHSMRFRQIAEMHSVSINTIQSRYRYGLDKLRTLLISEVNK